MPTLSDHKASRFVKLLYIGESGAGKTGSLASLVSAGYKLRILDFDNKLTVLRSFVEQSDPKLLANIQYETLRDKYKSMGPAGLQVVGSPKAFVDATKLLSKWSDDSIPAEAGPDTVFVLDSLSFLSQAALAWAKSIDPSSRDPRRWYNEAQRAVEHVLGLLTSEAFESNVIVTSHIQLIERLEKDPTTQQLNAVVDRVQVNSIGKALGPLIPNYFENFIMASRQGSGKATNRRISTIPTQELTLKTSAPFKVEQSYPLESGLASIFTTLKEGETP